MHGPTRNRTENLLIKSRSVAVLTAPVVLGQDARFGSCSPHREPDLPYVLPQAVQAGLPPGITEDELDGCCMHGDCALHCPDDLCHGNVCELCPESEADEEQDVEV